MSNRLLYAIITIVALVIGTKIPNASGSGIWRLIPKGSIQLEKFAANLSILDLSNHTSFELPKDRAVLSHKELSSFYCNNCSIHSIYKQSFAMLPLLMYLELNYNNLSCIHADAFEKNEQLHKVELIGNSLVKFNPEAALRHMRQLSHLKLDHNPSFDINEVTVELPWLTSFTCQHCNTSLIEKATMSRWKRLVYLRLSYNNVSQIKSDAFKGLTRFKYLNVDGNPELKELAFESETLLHLSAESCGLQGKLDTFSWEALESINIRSNKISKLAEHGFSKNRKIKKILLDDNYIEKIPEKLLEVPLYELERLCIDRNPLQPRELLRNFTLTYSSRKLRRGCLDDNDPTKQFEHILPFQTGKGLYRKLYDINEDDGPTFQKTANDIVYIERTFFRNVTFIKNVILDGNNRLSFPINNAFLQSDSITNLSLAYCAIEEVYVETFQQLPNIKFLNLRGNKIKTLPSRLIFKSNFLLEELDFSENVLTFIASTVFHDLKYLRALNLQQNRFITTVPGDPFLISSSLEFLNCHQCNFTEIDNVMLSGLTNLKSLNLSQNVIERVHPNAFSSTRKLRSLDLSDNKLAYFEPDLEKIDNLERLCLSGNENLSMSSTNIFLMYDSERVKQLEMDCKEDDFLDKIYEKKIYEQNFKVESKQLAYKYLDNDSSLTTESSTSSRPVEFSQNYLFGIIMVQIVAWMTVYRE